jgi:hypothetical protein
MPAQRNGRHRRFVDSTAATDSSLHSNNLRSAHTSSRRVVASRIMAFTWVVATSFTIGRSRTVYAASR